MMKDVSANLNSIRPGSLENRGVSNGARNVDKNDTRFREQLEALKNTMPAAQPGAAAGVNSPASLKFSNHAVDRMRARGIHFSPDQMAKIEGAVGKAQAKGAKETLLLTDDAALIVSIKDKTVVTVMDKNSLKENVFTNIDSTVML